MLTDDVLKAVTPEIYQRFKTAIEIKKWPNGDALSDNQLETCMQAIIMYENKYFAPEQRTGYIPAKKTECDSDQPLTWKDS